MTSSNIHENEFGGKAAELFKALKESAMKLKEDKIIFAEILKLINESESLLKSGKKSESFKKYNEAQKKIEAAMISNEANPLAWKLLYIEMGYLILLLLLAYFTYMWPKYFLWDGLINFHTQTVWFGALGGVTIAIYGIYEHIHLRDFDPKFELWYICKPIIGGIFGWFIFLIYFVGLVSVQGAGNTKINTPELPYVIAFLAGFSERFTLKMIDKLMSILISYEEKPSNDDAKKEKSS